MASSILMGMWIVISILVIILLFRLVIIIPKTYNLYSYKVAKEAGDTYMDARLLLGIEGKNLSEVASNLDEYLNTLLGVDLDEDELYCIVESNIYKHKNRVTGLSIISESIKTINMQPTVVEEEIYDNDGYDKI